MHWLEEIYLLFYDHQRGAGSRESVIFMRVKAVNTKSRKDAGLRAGLSANCNPLMVIRKRVYQTVRTFLSSHTALKTQNWFWSRQTGKNGDNKEEFYVGDDMDYYPDGCVTE